MLTHKNPISAMLGLALSPNPRDLMTDLPYVLLDDSLTPGGRSLLFAAPEEVVSVSDPAEVEAALEKVSAGLARGLHAAGFFAYELGYCLEPKLKHLLPEARRTPLFWIGLFKAPRPSTMRRRAPGSRKTAGPSAPRSPIFDCPGRARNMALPSPR